MSRGHGIAQRWVLEYLGRVALEDPTAWVFVDDIWINWGRDVEYGWTSIRRAVKSLEREGLVRTSYICSESRYPRILSRQVHSILAAQLTSQIPTSA